MIAGPHVIRCLHTASPLTAIASPPTSGAQPRGARRHRHDTDALGNNRLFVDGEPVGRATGGNFGFRVRKSLEMATARPEFAEVGTTVEMDTLGTMHRTAVIPESPFNPENGKLRG